MQRGLKAKVGEHLIFQIGPCFHKHSVANIKFHRVCGFE